MDFSEAQLFIQHDNQPARAAAPLTQWPFVHIMAVIGAARFCLTVNHDLAARLTRCGGSVLFQNLVDFEYVWWSTIKAMDGYFLDAFLLAIGPAWRSSGGK